MLSASPMSVTSLSDRTRTASPDSEGSDGGRAGQGAQRESLLVGTAVEHAIDEHRPADDRGRERVAGQERHQRGGRERPDREEPRIEERVADAQAADDPDRREDDGRGQESGRHGDRFDRAPGDLGRADEGQAHEPGQQRRTEPERADDIDPAGSSRRIPAGRCRPSDDERDQADRHVDEEDPAPRRREHVLPRSSETGALEGVLGVERGEDRGPDERADGHAEEGQRADDPERSWSARAVVEVGGSGRPDGYQHAAAERLDQPGGDELVEALGEPGQHRADDEDGQRTMNGRRAPHRSVEPAGQRHREDVHEQVAVDDPARLAELDPGGTAGGVGQVIEDRWQGDGRDHQLEAGQEHARPEHDEQHEGRPAIHAAECRRRRKAARGRSLRGTPRLTPPRRARHSAVHAPCRLDRHPRR